MSEKFEEIQPEALTSSNETKSPAVPSVDTEIIARLIGILNEQYLPYVKKAILRLELHSGEKSKRAVHELRDALDHIALALSTSVLKPDAVKNLNAVEEHLRRAAVEPVEWLALELLQKVLKIKQRGVWWWRLFMIKPPNSKELNDKIYSCQELIAQGRYYKGISLKDAYKALEDAYNILREILSEIEPAELNSRIFDVILVVVGLVLLPILTFLWKAGIVPFWGMIQKLWVG